MSSPLPAPIVRSVIRDWMLAKEPQLNRILEAVVQKLVPIAAEHATLMIAGCIDSDPQENVVAGLVKCLEHISVSLMCLDKYEGQLQLKDVVAGEVERLETMIDLHLKYAARRRADLRGEVVADNACCCKGGAS